MELELPLHIHWEMTTRCNLRCLHCYQQDDGLSKSPPEPSTLWRIAERIVEASVFELTLSGGEPLLVDLLPELVVFFNKHDIAPHIASNGTLIDAAAIEWMSAAQITFQVSIDSDDPEIHNGLRRSANAFSRAIGGVKMLVQAGVDVSIACVASLANLENLEGVIRLAHKLGVSRVCVGSVVPMFGDQSTRSNLEMSQAQYETAVRTLIDQREQFAGVLDIRVSFLDGYYVDDRLEPYSCTALARDLAILSDGSVCPCPFVRNKTYRLGNVLEQGIDNIWNCERAFLFREERQSGSSRHCLMVGKHHEVESAMYAKLGGELKEYNN